MSYLNIAQESSNRVAMGRHRKGQNKRRVRAHGGSMRGQKRAKAGNKGSGNLPKNKGKGLPKREEGGKGWKRGWRKKGGKWKQGNNNKGGDRQRNTKITIQLQILSSSLNSTARLFWGDLVALKLN